MLVCVVSDSSAVDGLVRLGDDRVMGTGHRDKLLTL